MCEREWTDELSVLGCVREWEYARLGESERMRETGTKIKIQNNIWRETKLKCFEASEGFRSEILPLSARPILEPLNGRTVDMKIIVITRIILLFELLLS